MTSTNLIPLVNKLHDVFNACGSSPLTLPQLVVVGSQSSGKSSVVELIVGRDFLPRGSGIVTRRPLLLQLINTRDEDSDSSDNDSDYVSEEEDIQNNQPVNQSINRPAHLRHPSNKSITPSNEMEYGVFLHAPARKFFDFSEIRREIEAETERVTGKNKGISNQPISLRLYSPNHLPLTLVDLPGLTKVPIGDQPEDIDKQIREMVLSFIAHPNSLILAVTPANTDLANSDALQIAAAVDPAGQRTLGILTKLDLMDKGTDAAALLKGEVYPLQHGFIGVVNRSQHDINTGKSIAAALKAERAFFASHPIYQSISHRLGTPYLTRRLNMLLMAHIQSVLPELRAKITATLSETNAELDSYGQPFSANDAASISSLLLPIISEFSACYTDALEGRASHLSFSELHGGARLAYVFKEVFTAAIMRMNSLDSLSDRDIRTAIRNASGPRTSLFIPEQAFELLIRKQIERLLMPSLDCVDLVLSELKRISSHCEAALVSLERFPILSERLHSCVNDVLDRCVEPTKQIITNLIQCELAYINTAHPDFIGGSSAVNQVMQAMQANQANNQPINQSNLQQSAAQYVQSVIHDSPQMKSHEPEFHSNPLLNNQSMQAPHPTQYQRQGWLSMLMGASNPGNHSMNGQASHQSTNQNNSQSNSGHASINHSSSSTGHSSPINQSRSINQPSSPPIKPMNQSGSQPANQSINQSPSLSLMTVNTSMSDREQIEVAVIKSLISSYFLIVKKTISDLIPKSIMAFMVNASKSKLQSALIEQLYVSDKWREWMQEGPEIKEKRRNCQELITLLNQALDIIHQARDYSE